jgi:hypothetical protein
MRIATYARQMLGALRGERGSALVLCFISLLLLSIMGLGLLAVAATDFAVAKNWADYSAAFYAADGGVEAARSALWTLLSTNPSPTAADLTGLNASQPSFSNSALSFSTYQVQYARTTAPFTYAMVIASGPWAGLNGLVTPYLLRSTVTTTSGDKADLTQGVQYVGVPLFQFGVFYGRGVDLEMAPGPAMTFNGRIHANSNIYLGAGATLNINSYMTTSGNIYRRIKGSSAMPWGNDPTILDASGNPQNLNFDHTYQTGFGSTWTPAQWQTQALSTFGGMVKDSAMGITDIVPPVPALFNNPSNPDQIAHQLIEVGQPSDTAGQISSKLYYKAGLKIVNGAITNLAGLPVVLPVGALTTHTFYDGREGHNMSVTDINVGLLTVAGLMPANGILYLGDTSGVNSVGFRLVNGSTLPTQGLTVVSQNPMYVQGDYNTVNKVPAAVLGDAITVLSNNWGCTSCVPLVLGNNSDTKGSQAVGNRPATSTTVNAAFALASNTESTLANGGNGQLENLIRFLEDWSGQSFNYNGSLIALWHSLMATGNWQQPGAYYQPPIRNWTYDTTFNSTPPPGTPQGVLITRGAWWQN